MIKLLIVDDSPLMRRLFGDLFAAEGDFEIAFARNGAEALEAMRESRPDVVTLDVQMPHIDGLGCLDRIMLENPTPVVMVSGLTEEGADESLRAMDLGAVDFIPKPAGALSLRIHEFGPLLVEKVRAAAQAKLPKSHRLRERLRARHDTGVARGEWGIEPVAPAALPKRTRPRLRIRNPVVGEGLILVGASTGGPPALDMLLSSLPAELPWPVVIAQHMPATFTAALARRLDGLTPLSVSEVSRPTALRAGAVYVGRGDADVIISRRAGQLIAMSAPSDPEYRWHPSVDRLVLSAIDHLPAERLAGVLLTGMGTDGAASLARVRELGGYTIAEAEETAVVWGMPGELARLNGASVVAPRERVASLLIAAVQTP